MRTPHLTFQNQLPEFVREDYPRFVEFIKSYYKYLDALAAYDVGDSLDIDTVSDSLLDQFFNTYAKGLPTPKNFTKREFLRHCKEFYSTKGTAASFNFLFKAFFNKTAEILIPGDEIIRASGGNWQQLHAIEIEVLFGSIDVITDNYELDLSNSHGSYTAVIAERKHLYGAKHRLYFKKQTIMSLDVDQLVEIAVGNAVGLRFRIVTTPTKIEILEPGSNFVRGMIVQIPSTYKSTVARVASVSSTGGIQSLESMEYGYEHSDGDVALISPYANKPIGTTYDLNSTTIGTNTTYNLTINDYVESIDESWGAEYSQVGIPGYTFLDYVAAGYVSYFGTTSATSTSVDPGTGILDSGLTIEQWLNSRARVKLTKGMIAAQPGKYLNSQSILSDPYARIQDNYYYQLYSYVIRSEVDEKDYKPILSIIHPAGMKRFGEILKTNTYDIGTDVGIELTKTTVGT